MIDGSISLRAAYDHDAALFRYRYTFALTSDVMRDVHHFESDHVSLLVRVYAAIERFARVSGCAMSRIDDAMIWAT